MPLPTRDLGRLPYGDAYRIQLDYLDQVLKARESGTPIRGFLLLVEHPPVITISRRAGASNHLLVTPAMLAAAGVAVEETDRGGDITYHGPGQLVVYPILDLNLLNLGLHDYMRLLEQAVIETCAHFGVATTRDPAATGVWTIPLATIDASAAQPSAKIAAMGVRVRRWVSMHGLALNVTTNLDHFSLIVPCGLAGRAVTSLQRELGARCPGFSEVASVLVAALTRHVEGAANAAAAKRVASGAVPYG